MCQSVSNDTPNANSHGGRMKNSTVASTLVQTLQRQTEAVTATKPQNNLGDDDATQHQTCTASSQWRRHAEPDGDDQFRRRAAGARQVPVPRPQ
ncbi:hypothetical protein MPLA_1430031 [Mesorhizobium sp. ORS 3359]|nr:hypothetical protein MPLA_1430031 [Mesorhizobium sp. ORS 3359]